MDDELDEFLNPRTVTPLLLNIYADSLVVLDRVGVIEEFLQYVRRRIRELGLRRVRDGRAVVKLLRFSHRFTRVDASYMLMSRPVRL